jgi:signal peptidase I
MQKIKKRIRFVLKHCWPVLLLVTLYLSIFTQIKIVSGSMEPTLMTGDRAMITNDWLFYKPQRGDIVGFAMGNEIWVKRVIGLPGDKIEFLMGVILVNGEVLEEPYLPEGTYTYGGTQEVYEVPEGYVFLLGDNREFSDDSRYWDNPYIPIRRVIGKYRLTIFHAKRDTAGQ